MLLIICLHRLVGLRLLRLCLKLRQGFALYPQGVSPLDPDQGRVPGPFARYARCCLLLCSGDLLGVALPIPHSSLLTPHSKKLYALSTLSRFVVPLIPSGTPAVITTRSPFLRYPSSTERSSACLISSSVLVFSSIIPACMPHERFSW